MKGVPIDVERILAFERLFPMYTGSMTALIEESFTGVHLQSFVLMQTVEPLEGFIADLATAQGFERGERVIHRHALLYDGKTKENFLYASCLLKRSVFPEAVVRGICQRREVPLGRHLGDIPLEKAILSTMNRPCGMFLAEQFSREESECCHARRVLFKLDKKPALLIEEIFPCRSGRDCPL
jgi:chorismate-pyruvate lyase